MNPMYKSCTVALPVERNCATFTDKAATTTATRLQPISLKALANKVLERNKGRNQTATSKETDRNFLPETNPLKLRSCNSSGNEDHKPTPQKSDDQQEIPLHENLKPCCLCGGVLFHRSNGGGYFCIQCQVLQDDEVDSIVRAPGPDPAGDGPEPGELPWQVNCQGFKHNGVLMATTPDSCLQWQGEFCRGCTLSTIQ
jgi:hypothetical protein